MNNVYWFAYAAPPNILRKKQKNKIPSISETLHMERDGAAFAFVQACLPSRFRFKDIILNFPPSVFKKKQQEPHTLSSGDLIIMVTRPPLSDDDEYDRKTVWKSETKFEKDIFNSIQGVIKYCSRTEVKIDPAKLTSNEHSERAYHKFGLHTFPGICSYGKSDLKNKRAPDIMRKKTLGFLFYTPSIYPNDKGPALLLSFGISGTASLIWATTLGGLIDFDILLSKSESRLFVGQFDIPTDELPSSVADYASKTSVSAIIDVSW